MRREGRSRPPACRWWPTGVLAVAALLLGVAACRTVGGVADHPVYSKPRYGSDRFVQVRGYSIHYVEAGLGRPVLLIPGAFTTYRAWNRIGPGLSLHRRVLAVDYLGVGDSDKPETGFGYTVAEQADVLAEMIRTLGLAKPSLVGASYGGAVALNLAARYPDLVDKVLCIEGGALITPEVLRYSKLGALIEWPILGHIIWGFMQSGLFDRVTARSVMGAAWEGLSRDEQGEIVGIVAANIRTTTKSSWNGIYRAITNGIDFTDALARAPVRALYLYGEDSKYRAVAELNAQRFAESNPTIQVASLQGGIHDLHLQVPHAVTAIILQFLEAEAVPSVVPEPTAAPEIKDEVAPGRLMD